eukprot:181403-Hanusia_phi.AAC.1
MHMNDSQPRRWLVHISNRYLVPAVLWLMHAGISIPSSAPETVATRRQKQQTVRTMKRCKVLRLYAEEIALVTSEIALVTPAWLMSLQRRWQLAEDLIE